MNELRYCFDKISKIKNPKLLCQIMRTLPLFRDQLFNKKSQIYGIFLPSLRTNIEECVSKFVT